MIASILQPLNRDEMSLAESFLNEAQQNIRVLVKGSNLRNLLKLRLSYFMTRKDAANNDLYTGITGPLLELDAMPAAELAEAIGYQSFEAGLGYGAFGCGNCLNYIASMHDLDGIISLLRLQLADPDSPASFVAESAITSPYTEGPFDFDPATGILSFTCLTRRFEGQCRVRVFE